MNVAVPTNPEDETRPVRFKEILIVDQDETWALVMRDAVAEGGFRVSVATMLEEAIRIVRDESPDLLLVSCLVEGPVSEALLRELEGLKRRPPVVLVGLQSGDERWQAWVHRPFVTAIRQPFKSRDVLQVAVALLGSTWEDLTGSAQ